MATTAMSFNRVLLDGCEVRCFQQVGDIVHTWHETILGTYLGEEELMSPEAACGWLFYYHRNGCQLWTDN